MKVFLGRMKRHLHTKRYLRHLIEVAPCSI